MKLAFFDYNLNFGGAPRGSIDLCDNLASSGIDVVVFDVYGVNEKYHAYIKRKNLSCVIVKPSRTAQFIGGKSLLGKLMRGAAQLPVFIKIFYNTRIGFVQEDVDVVLVNNFKSFLTVVISSFGLKIKKIYYHRGWAEPHSFDFFEKLIVGKFCHALIGHSHSTVKNLRLVFPGINTHYVNNFVTNRVREKPDLTRAAKFKLLLPAARPVYEKGHHTALEALVILKKKGFENIELLFPGVIPIGSSVNYVKDLKSYIDNNNLKNDVVFMGWLDSLEEVILQSNMVILPSHTEGFPRVLIEAMLLNTLVAATPVGGIPEAIKDGETGFLFMPNDAKTLADIIEKVTQEPVLAQQLAMNARYYASENFSKEKQVKIVTQVLQEVLD